MLFGRKRLLGLDVGSSAIKAVEVVARGGDLTLTGHGVLARGDEHVGAAVARLVSTFGMRSKRAAAAVSGRSVIVRYIAMDPVADAELADAIRVEADKYIPFEIDEVRLDCQRLTEPAMGEQAKVLMVAAKRTLINEKIQAIQSAGLQPSVIDVDAFALGNAYELRGNHEGAVALIDIGNSKTDVNIRLGQMTMFTREVYLGGADFDEAIARELGISEPEAQRLKEAPYDEHERVMAALGPVIADLGHEVLLSLQFFESQTGRGVDHILLSGGSAGLEGLAETLGATLERGVAEWNPTEALRIGGSVDREALARDSNRLAVAVGLASRALDS